VVCHRTGVLTADERSPQGQLSRCGPPRTTVETRSERSLEKTDLTHNDTSVSTPSAETIGPHP